jgi:glutathione S-transferase
MLTLYDFLFSGNGYRVRLTLRELGLPFVYREVDILRGETREPWFLSKNPAGQIPVLELEDGTCLSESTAILFFLAEGSELIPRAPLSRARVLQWMCFEQTNVDGVISRARFRKRYPEVIETRPDEFVAWWRDGARALRVLDEHLRRRQFLVDERFTIADIAVYSYVHKAGEGGFDLAPYEALRAWFERIEGRPAYLPIEIAPEPTEVAPSGQASLSGKGRDSPP